MVKQKSLWLLKDQQGRVQGPVDRDGIHQMIENHLLSGEESIAPYPGGKWKTLSLEPQFYDHLLRVFSGKSSVKEKKSTPDFDSDKSSYLDLPVEEEESPTAVASSADLQKLTRKRQKRKNIKTLGSLKRQKQSQEDTLLYEIPEEIEEPSLRKLKAEEIKKSRFQLSSFLKWSFVLFFTAGVLVFFFYDKIKKTSTAEEYIDLKAPRWNRPALPSKRVDLLAKKGLLEFFKSRFSSYLKSQALFIQAIEGDVKNKQAISFLCLVYMDLWPFSRQDFKSSRVLLHVTRKISVLNKGGIYSGLCQSVHFLVKGKYLDAKTMIESSLDGLANASREDESQRLLPMFYYLKALSLYYLGDYSTIIGYLDTIQKMIPSWIAPYMLLGDIMMKQEKHSSALSLYRKILKLHPNNKEAQIKTGLIEYKFFGKKNKAEKSLMIALQNADRISYQTLSEAYLGLAEINLKKNNSLVALDYARKSYSYNPANNVARNLVTQLGGIKKLKQTKVKSGQLIYEGDQLTLQNRFQFAIGYYEEAFKLDGNKNAMIAIKIAKNFWTLSFFENAIKWLKKAIEADPYMMESYVLMSDYYSQQYDFYKASKILAIATRKSPRSYEVYRGKAYLEFKKEAYRQAIRYAKIALKIYEADIESLVILSSAYGKLGDANESLAFASRAIEMDPNSTKTQVAYAKALGYVYGVDTGANHFRKLVNNYSLVMEYRMEWAKYLFEDERYKASYNILLGIIEVEPKYNEAYLYLGRILMFENNYQKAYEAFLQAAILNPADPTPSFYIGLLRLKEKKYGLAKKQFEKVLAVNELYLRAHYYLGRVALLQGGKTNYYEAIKQAKLETQFNSKLIVPFLLSAEAYEKLGNFLNCAIEYQKAIELDPENLTFYVRTARCYRKSGHLDLAVKILKKAGGADSVLKSGDPQLYKELGFVYEMRGAYQEASGSYCNYLNLLPEAPDRPSIETRMKKLAERAGKKMQKCG